MRIEHIGDATLYLGDCLEILPTLGKVDFIYADPPYGVGKAEWDGQYFTGWERQCVEMSMHGLVANTGAKALPVAIEALGEDFRDLFYAWNLNGMTRSSIGFMNVLIAVVAGKNVRMGQNFAKFCIRDLTRKDHPSPKPIEYIHCIIDRFTLNGELVLDPFMGSGTTGVACANLGRKFIGIEIEEKYFDIACRRIADAYKQPRLFYDKDVPKYTQHEMSLEEPA